VLALAALAAGCSPREAELDSASRLTARQRDSVLSRSELPGAGVAARALEHSDDAAARAANLGATVDSLGR